MMDNPLVNVLKAKYEEIKRAIEDGRQVFIGGVQVRSVELVATKRSMVMVVNGEIIIYPSQLRAYRVTIV